MSDDADEAQVRTVPGDDAGDAVVATAAVGRFVVLGELGSGGMGLVLLAHDPDLDRRVAVKVLRPPTPGRSDEALRRAQLQREAQAMARLSHPNVVAVYEVGLVGDQTYIAMELVAGDTLRAWLRQPRAWRAVVSMFVAAGRGLAAAHETGLVHRDFKPDNVLVGSDGRPRVGDFGLVGNGARSPDGSGELDATFGTPGYMSPEYVAGGAVDARSDQFAFCVAVWEALWGERPAPGAPKPTERRGVPRSIQAALRRGLAPDPDARWPALAPLLDALETAARPSRSPRIDIAVVALATVAAVAFAVLRAAPAWRPVLRQHLPAYEENSESLAISPDGKLLAYSSDREQANVPRAYVAPLEGGPSRAVSPPERSVFAVRWTRDGAAVLGIDVRDRVAWRFPLDGSAAQPLGRPARAVEDCAGLLVLSHVSSPECATCGRIVAVERGGAERELVRFPAGTLAHQLSCDRTGRRLLYVPFAATVMPTYSRTDVWLLDLDSGATRALTSDGRNTYPVFGPDGESAIFASLAAGGSTAHVWELPLAGGAARQLTFGDSDELSPVVSPDGRLLVYNADRTSTLLFGYTAGGRRRIATSRTSLISLAITPDGREVVAQSQLGVRERIVAISLSDGSERLLADHGVEPALTADGAEVIYVEAPRRTRVLAVPRAGGAPREIASVDGSVLRLAVGTDGLVHLGIARDDTFFAEAVPLAGGTPSLEAPRPWCHVVPAPAGGWRVAVHCGAARLELHLIPPGAPLDDPAARVLEAKRFVWDQRGESLVFDDQRVVKRIDVATGTQSELAAAPLAAAFAPAPDRATVYVAEIAGHADRIMVTNFGARPWARR